jgi:hypothetical protein
LEYGPIAGRFSDSADVRGDCARRLRVCEAFERHSHKWSPNELIIALPLKDFDTAIESIPHSGYGTAQT